MRNFITVCLLFVGLTMFSQEDATLIDQGKEIISEYVDVESTLAQVTSIKELFVHYFKETVEGSKDLVGNGVKQVEKAVEVLYEQSTIIVRQFIIYTSISYLIPILLGVWLIFKLPSTITKRLSMNTDKALAFNENLINEEKEEKDGVSEYFVAANSKPSYLGNFYKNKFTLISANLGTYIGYALGGYLVFFNVMPFIKVTFFSKLYLVEMLLKYI